MNDDTKLLQAIALAIGATYMVDHELAGYEEGYLLPGSEVVANPLLDDGDAMRLSTLRLVDIQHAPTWVQGGSFREGWQPIVNGDRAAAARRAVATAVAATRGNDWAT